MPKKRWDEFSGAQKGAIVLTGAVQPGLWAAALVDIYRRPAGEIRGGERLWVTAAFINYVGPISYFLFGRKR
jgi:Phospholipase_D-nuclease N-terminal